MSNTIKMHFFARNTTTPGYPVPRDVIELSEGSDDWVEFSGSHAELVEDAEQALANPLSDEWSCKCARQILESLCETI